MMFAMGAYTEHGERYSKRNARGVLYALLVVGVGLPTAAGVGMLLEPMDTVDLVIFVGVLVLWLITLTMVLIRFSKVSCPRCQTQSSRGKYLTKCPSCDLRMLQEEP